MDEKALLWLTHLQVRDLNISHRLGQCPVKGRDKEYYRKSEKPELIMNREQTGELQEVGTDLSLEVHGTRHVGFLKATLCSPF